MLTFKCPKCGGGTLECKLTRIYDVTLIPYEFSDFINVELDDGEDIDDGIYCCHNCDWEFNGSAETMREKGWVS